LLRKWNGLKYIEVPSKITLRLRESRKSKKKKKYVGRLLKQVIHSFNNLKKKGLSITVNSSTVKCPIIPLAPNNPHKVKLDSIPNQAAFMVAHIYEVNILSARIAPVYIENKSTFAICQ
jgi:hypothetical protein